MGKLFSPPGVPRYNGAIEAGIGSLKARAEQHATRHGHRGAWTWDDVGTILRRWNEIKMKSVNSQNCLAREEFNVNINSVKAASSYVPFLVNKITDVEEESTAVEVPWGFYFASQQRRILTRAMTTDLASCIAYIFWDEDKRNFFFAHVSTNGEACSVVSLVKELSGNEYSEGALFICVTGRMPQDTTTQRINHIVENLDKPHRFFNTDTGGVTIDLSLETLVRARKPKAHITAVSKEEKKDAKAKDQKFPLIGIKVSNSWVGTGTIDCPKMKVTRGRSGSLGKTDYS